MITTFTVTPVAGGAYRLDWDGDLAEPVMYYVYRDGALALATEQKSLVVAPSPRESPVYEVFDSASDRPAFAYPGHATLAWYAAPGAAEYRVEQLVSGQWVELISVTDDGRGYFAWRSRTLADGAEHQVRVTPVGVNGNDGAPRTFLLLMVRVPDPPKVSYAYDAGAGTVTISAA